MLKNKPRTPPGPELTELFGLFPPAVDLPEFALVAPETMPDAFRDLLFHEHHMTVTVEAHHGAAVDVRVLASRQLGDVYARKIVLTLRGSGKVVLFGIIRINLDFCSQPVREAIVAEKTPLGRVLIDHNVLRRIEVTDYFRVKPGPKQLAWFNLRKPVPLYGRLGIIYCDEQPAVELLEIVIAKAEAYGPAMGLT